MSYFLLPSLADKYKCDLINIRDPWKSYLKDNDLEPAVLLSDGIHLNDYGNFLMAELVKPLFCFKPSIPDDPFHLLTEYKGREVLNFKNDTLILPFTGNRVDLVYRASASAHHDSARVFLDGAAPSSFQGTYYLTRPYNSKGAVWPWDLPAMIRVEHSVPWIAEEWSCVFTKAKPPYRNFRFRISGSVTGEDGHGRASNDFISRSGRVIIKKGDAETGGDWHLQRSYKVLKTIISKGDSVKWKTYSISTDIVVPSKIRESAALATVIIFQGISNERHTLEIVKKGEHFPSLSAIKVYRPFWNR